MALSYYQTVLADKPVAYWRLDDLAGPVKDSGSSGVTGALNGGVTRNVPGAISDSNPAMSFNGTNGYIDLGTPSGLAKVKMSAEAFIKFTSVALMGIVDRRTTPGATGGFSMQTNALGGVEWYVHVGFMTFVTAQSVNDGAWHHVVGTFDGVSQIIYLDGVLKSSSALVGAINDPGASTPASIGRMTHNGAGWFDGSLDEIAIYGYALSAAQVLAHYNAGIVAIASAVASTAPGPVTNQAPFAPQLTVIFPQALPQAQR